MAGSTCVRAGWQLCQFTQTLGHLCTAAALQIGTADAACKQVSPQKRYSPHSSTTPPGVWPGVCQTVNCSSSTETVSPSA